VEFDPAVAGTTFFGVVRVERFVESKSGRRELLAIDAVLHEPVRHGGGTRVAEPLVEVGSALVVGVTFDAPMPLPA